MKALVYKSTGSWYIVKTMEEGRIFNARLKGVFKMEGLSSTNPIAVGDEVEIEPENETDNTAVINTIHKRRNYINRSSPKSQHHYHIIASNLDQSLLIATLKEPRTSEGFIDRFLVGCEAYHIPAVIVFNKTDLYGKKEQAKFETLKEIYEQAGYKVLPMSVAKGEGVNEVMSILKDKVTLVSGHSGVGKSSFINHVFQGNRELRTQQVSNWSGKGMHTTTFAEMMDIPGGGKIIDTPGIREFGIVDMEKEELSHYFPEMRKVLNDCQFNNCMHINEPGCAVKAAVNENQISVERYASYLGILDSLKPRPYR